MNVWSETLTIHDLHRAVDQVNDEFPGADVMLDHGAMELLAGPRIRRRRIEYVHLRTSRGTYRPNSGTYGRERSYSDMPYAASWTEWGWFLARVFERDPNARCGDYRGVQDFHAKTHGRFIEPRTPRQRQIKRTMTVGSSV